MKTITINGNDYNLEYTFEAAAYTPVVQTMFEIVSGTWLFKGVKNVADNEENVAVDMFEGTASLVANIPKITMDAFYCGLLEHHSDITKEQAKELLKAYMIENKLTFDVVYEEIKEAMEKDGFFELSGIKAMVAKMNPENNKKQTKQTKQTEKSEK